MKLNTSQSLKQVFIENLFPDVFTQYWKLATVINLDDDYNLDTHFLTGGQTYFLHQKLCMGPVPLLLLPACMDMSPIIHPAKVIKHKSQEEKIHVFVFIKEKIQQCHVIIQTNLKSSHGSCSSGSLKEEFTKYSNVSERNQLTRLIMVILLSHLNIVFWADRKKIKPKIYSAHTI